MRGVVFDLDGVITDTAKYHFQAWRALAEQKLKIELPEKFESELKGISRTDSLERILKFAGKSEEYSSEQVAKMAAEKNNLYLDKIEALTEADILPGISALLQELKTHQMKISLASASKNAPFILKKLKLDTVFDTIVDPSKVSAGKPAPDIFIQGAAQLNLTCADCVGIEDAKAGVKAIKAAKMTAVGVGNHQELAQADVIVDDTSGLNYSLLLEAWNQVQKNG